LTHHYHPHHCNAVVVIIILIMIIFRHTFCPPPQRVRKRPKRRGLSLLCSCMCRRAKSVGSFTLRRLATMNNNDNNDNDDPISLLYAIRLLRRPRTWKLPPQGTLSIPLSRGYVSLDASHPWMVYWCLHSLNILGYFH
jgi:hypothetical protein